MSLTYVSAQEPRAASGKAGANEKWGIPGPYPGRVIEVRNPRMIKNDVKDRGAIHAAVDRGMKELTGATDAVEAWRSFVEPGDVVGVKMNPVGNPLANSSNELMLEVDRRAPGGRGQEERYHHLRAVSRRIHRGQDAPGRARRHRLDRAGDRLQRQAGGHQRGRREDRQPRPDHRLRPRRVHGDGGRHARPRSQGRADPSLAPRPARDPAGQQARAHARPEGPRLGRGHRGAQEHEPRAGQ